MQLNIKKKQTTQSNYKERAQKKEGTKKNYRNNQKIMNKMAISTYLSIITLNVNGLSAQIKRHRLAERIQKQDPYILPTGDPLQI